MTDATKSAGEPRELALVANLNELRGLTNELREELPHVNDGHLQPTITTLVETADAVFTAHGNDPKPTIADDLSLLMSAVRALKIPLRDPDLDARTPTLERLRTSKGLIVAGLADALESAAALGLRPQKPPIPSEVAAALPRSEMEGLLQGILKRLTQVEKSLDALDEAKSAPTSFAQQTGLVNFYISSMRAEIDLAKLHITVGDKTVDFNALARAAETMGGLTRDFVSTVKAWGSRVAERVVEIATEVPRRVRKVASGVKASTHWMIRTIRRRGRTAARPETEVVDKPLLDVTPTDFDIDDTREMILAGKAPPYTWRPHIHELDLSYTALSDLWPLKGLGNLRSLNLRETQVSDLAPLDGLKNLRSLDLEGTHVSDLATLDRFPDLEDVNLGRTQVTDLTPLGIHTSFRSLHLHGTQVRDLTPLANLDRVEVLNLQDTKVLDLAPLSSVEIFSLDLRGTKVSDFRPVAQVIVLIKPDGTILRRSPDEQEPPLPFENPPQ